MTRTILLFLACSILTPAALAQQLPPPQDPADATPKIPPQAPALIPPQNAARPVLSLPKGGLALPPQQNPAAAAAKNNLGKPPEFFAARRQAQRDRKQAQLDRMKQFKAARAAEEQKLYEDWHERYLADTPVRIALARAYEADAVAWRTPYVYAAPPIIVPIIYTPVIYAPAYPPPVYGTFISWGW